MKILFVHCLANRDIGGGAEVSIWTLMLSLAKKGHECVFIVTDDGKGARCCIVDGIKVWYVGIINLYWPFSRSIHTSLRQRLWHVLDSFNPWMAREFEKILLLENPDVVSCHNLPGWSCAVWSIAKKAKKPCVQVLHDFYNICILSTKYRYGTSCKGQCLRCKVFRIPQRFFCSVSAVVGISNYVLAEHLFYGYFKNVSIKSVIYNRRDVRLLKSNGIKYFKNNNDIVLGFIGSLVPAKGVQLLIEAFSHFPMHSIKLLIAGDGDDNFVKSLEKKANENAVFLGRVNPDIFYSQVDVVVVPSLWNEPLGMVVAESFIFGKPVIGSNKGGIQEMITHGVNGLVFDPDKCNDLREKIFLFCTDYNLRKQLVAGAKASGHFFSDTDAWVQEYVNLYESVC